MEYSDAKIHNKLFKTSIPPFQYSTIPVVHSTVYTLPNVGTKFCERTPIALQTGQSDVR